MFAWRYLDHEGQEVGSSEPFRTRQAAEEWIGLAWPDLSSNGIEAVAMVDQERGDVLYRMALTPEAAES
jgi:hypothetical protein